MFVCMDFGKRLRAMRKAAGLTQVELAKRANITQGAISDLERGESKASHSDTLVALAKVLECNPEWLSTGRGSPVPELRPNTPEAAELVAIYNVLPEPLRNTLLATARSLLDAIPAAPSALNPYPKVPN